MTKETNLIVEEIWRSHPDYLGTQSGKPVHDEAVDYFSRLFCPGPSFYYIIDSPTLTLDITGGATRELFGVAPENFSLGFLVSKIHPDDVDYFLKYEDVVAYFLKNSIAPHRVTDYKIVSCLRLLKADGIYSLFLIQTTTVKTTPSGALLKVFGCISDIGHISKEQNFRMSLIDMQNENSLMDIDVMQKDLLAGYTPFKYTKIRQLLTRRELDIAKLLGRGFSTAHIAEQLCISTQTVYTHRKNMLRKTGKKNTAELVADCIRKGYI